MVVKKFVIISLAVLCISIAFAITEEWNLPAGQMVYQTCADGAGGCAIFYLKTNGTTRISWLDKKGIEKYGKVINLAFPTPIVVCTKKQLVFSDFPTNGLPYMISVDSKGQESEIKMNYSAIYPASITSIPGNTSFNDKKSFFSAIPGNASFSDKKGFFAQTITTNSGMSTFHRFSYK